MPNRTPKFVSAVFGGILAGAILAPVTDIHAKDAEDNCLSAPKGATPANGHWYYRIDRATKRNCWYIKNENEKSARSAPQDSSSSAPPASTTASAPVNLVPPKPSTNARKSIADARAELTSMPMRDEQDTSVSVDPRVNAAGVQNSQRAATTEAAAPASPISSRWPDTAAASPSSDLRVAAADPPESPPENAETTSQPAVTPAALAAADPTLEKQSASMQMLFLVMAGALTLAGLTASVIFRFGRARAKQPEIRGSRRINWDSVQASSSPPIFPSEDVPMWHRDAPVNASANTLHNSRSHNRRDARASDDPERRVTELLSRLARSAQS